MKKMYLMVAIGTGILIPLLYAITTVSPDQPSMEYLEPEARDLGIDRTWLLAIKEDPIVKKAEDASVLALPQEAYTLWLTAANECAQLNKVNETRYCLYKRRVYMAHGSTLPFMWAFIVDLGIQIEQSKQSTMPANPLSIAITNNAIEFIEASMPREALVVSQLSPDIQMAICHALMALLGQAITMNRIPIVSTLVNRIKRYMLWDHPVVLQLKPWLMKNAPKNKEMRQTLINAGFSVQ